MAPRGQRAFDLTGVQLGLDGRSYAPTPHPAWEDWLDSAPAPWADGEDLVEPEPAPTTGQQVFGPLEPWVTAQPLLPLFTTTWERDNPKGYTVSMTGGEWREAAAECLAHAARCLRAFPVLHPWKEKHKKKKKSPRSTKPVGLRLIEYLERGAREILDCDSTWRMPVAECGARDEDHAILIDGCDSKLCPRCQNLRAETLGAAGTMWAKSHSVMRWRKGQKHSHGMSRDYYTGDHTLYKSPTFTVLQLRAEVEELQRFRYLAFRNVFRMLPRKKSGHYGEYPGICDEAGMVGGIEFGPHMNPHDHYARYGAHHWSEDFRQATGGYWTKDLHVRDKRGRPGQEAVAGAFGETLKYPFMLSNKCGHHDYLHPWYATLIAIATFYKHLVQGYGTMSGLVKQAEDALLAARQGVVPQPAEVERDVLRTLEDRPCSRCGCNAPGHWRYKNVKHDTGVGAFMRRRMEREQAVRPPPGGT